MFCSCYEIHGLLWGWKYKLNLSKKNLTENLPLLLSWQNRFHSAHVHHHETLRLEELVVRHLPRHLEFLVLPLLQLQQLAHYAGATQTQLLISSLFWCPNRLHLCKRWKFIIKGPFTLRVSVNAVNTAMMPDEISILTHFGTTPLFLIRAVSLEASQRWRGCSV